MRMASPKFAVNFYGARCHNGFMSIGGRVERLAGGKLGIVHLDCGALNEIAPNGRDPEARELWRVVCEVLSIQ
jgi:hypothetical protein